MQAIRELTGQTDRSALRRAAEINIYGVGLAALWNTLNTLLLPGRITDVVPDALRGSGLGLISFLGIGIAALVQPVAGHLSDYAPFPDRRRPFIWGGTALMVVWLALFWTVPNFWLLIAAYILLQVASNGAQAAFQALIPDLVPKHSRGLASGVKNALNVIGIAVGLIGVQALLKVTGSATAGVVYLASVLVITAVLCIWWVSPVPPLPEDQRPDSLKTAFALGRLARSFVATFRSHHRFALTVLTEFLFLLGIYPLQRFLIYFLEDRFNVRNAAERAAGVLVVAIVLGIASALGAGALSDAIGRVRILFGSVIVGCVGLTGVALGPTLGLVTAGGMLVAIGTGSFLAVIWALLSDDIPEGQGAQFYGLANLAVAGSSALAGAWGPLIDLAGHFLPGDPYRLSFTIATLISLSSLIPLRLLAQGTEPDERAH